MPTNNGRASYDTLINEQSPNTNYGDWNKITVVGGPVGQRRYAYLYFPGIPPSGSTIISATLRLWLADTSWSGGPHTITARRINGSWKEDLLTWTRALNGALGASSPNPASVAVTGGTNKQMVELDVSLMVADVAAGQFWGGIRLEVNTSDGVPRRLYSSEASDPALRPQLIVEWNRAPLAPVDMAPSGGRSVSLNKPVLNWVYKDREGDEQSAFQVQISTSSATTSSGFTSVEFDSGWVTSSDTELNLASTAYAGVADGATRYWIVRVRDTAGLTSGWSSVASFRRDVKGTFVINSPINGGTVDETTPPITTTLTGRAQEAISYTLQEDDGTGKYITVWSQGRFAAAATDGATYSFNVPSGKIKRTGRNYKVIVRSWDTVDREGTPGDPVYRQAVSTFTFVRSTPSPVTSLTVVNSEPGVKLTWNRAAGVGAPDFWCLKVDGVRVFDRLDPDDYLVGGDPIVYEMVYYGATCMEQHTFEMEAVVLDAGKYKHSTGDVTQQFTPTTEGIWLVDDVDPPFAPDALPRRVRIRGKDFPDLQIGESSATFYPVGREDPVYIVDAIRGKEGPITGTVDADEGVDFIDNFEWMKYEENVGRRFRLVFGDINIPVQLGQAKDTHVDYHHRRHQVSVEVSQIGEFRD